MSTLKTNTLSNAAGSKSVPVDTVVDGTAKAWVNFNGTGTVAIRASFNVSSITDNGTGSYTVNMTNAMLDANYATQLTVDSGLRHNVSSQATGSLTVATFNTAGAAADLTGVYVSIFR